MGFVHNAFVIVLIGLGAISAGTMFVFSAAQATSKEKTSQGNFLTVSGNLDGNVCADYLLFANNRPIRVLVDGDDEYLSCSWKFRNDVVRFSISIFGLGMCALGVWALLKNKKWFMFLFILGAFVVSFTFFAAMCLDANDIRISNDWCADKLIGALVLGPDNNPVNFVCSYLPFITTASFDGISSLLWGAILYFSFKHARRHMGDPHIGEEEQYDSLVKNPETTHV